MWKYDHACDVEEERSGGAAATVGRKAMQVQKERSSKRQLFDCGIWFETAALVSRINTQLPQSW